MAEFVMPKLGSDMSAGTLVTWLRKPGDAVHHGDIIAEVETEKGVIGVEAFVDGVLQRQLVSPGNRVPVGAALAIIDEQGKETRPAAKPSAPPSNRRPRISPSARALAHQLGVDVDEVAGTGADGAITREDIERMASAPKKHLTIDRSADMRKTIALAMSRSKREAPHYYLSTTIDLHAALTWVEGINFERPVEQRLLPGVLFIKAVALALRQVPELNSLWSPNGPEVQENIHVGVAVSLRQGGLIAPALRNVDHQDIDTLMRQFQEIVARAKSGNLRSSELADPTITVTSLGERGVETVFPIIYPPQAAIVGFGKVVERPWVVGGQVVPRRVVTATLAADHRVSDGHRGALFLAAVDHLLQEPEKL